MMFRAAQGVVLAVLGLCLAGPARAEQVKTAPTLYNAMKEEMAKQGTAQNGFPKPVTSYGMKTTVPYNPPPKVEKKAEVKPEPAPAAKAESGPSRLQKIMADYLAPDETEQDGKESDAKAAKKKDKVAPEDKMIFTRTTEDPVETPQRLFDVR